MWRCRGQKGFSLVETLVVVSTTALLLGMLLPSLQTARQQAQKTVCLSNLRQMATAAHSYSAAYDEHYPLAYYNRQEGDVVRSYAWDFTTWKEWSGSNGTTHVRTGLLWMGQAIEKVQQCPTFKGVSSTAADPYTGYNYNTSYIGLIDTLSPVDSAKVTDVGRPAETALFGDGQFPTGGANKYMRAPFSHPGDTLLPDSARYAGVQGYRHMGSTNVAFCDGHVGPWSEIFTETDSTGKKILDAHNVAGNVQVGFLSADNSMYDLK